MAEEVPHCLHTQGLHLSVCWSKTDPLREWAAARDLRLYIPGVVSGGGVGWRVKRSRQWSGPVLGAVVLPLEAWADTRGGAKRA